MDIRNNPQLQIFVQLFNEKNKHINLSAIRDEEEVWTKHIEDSLMIIPLLQEFKGQSTKYKIEVLDLGTGGGFPGIPLAIMFPECHFTLLDARRKKVECVAEFASQLGLQNVDCVWGRAENLQDYTEQKEGIVQIFPETINDKRLTINGYDIIVSRATAYITDLLAWIRPILHAEGRAWLYKSASQEEWDDGVRMAQTLGLKLTKPLIYELAGQTRWIIEVSKI